VEPADFDQDGDMDLFVGSRSVPGKYGLSASSHILENDGNGNFIDVTSQIAPQLLDIGMVSDAVWTDINKDKKEDLILCGEWMPIKVFRNTGGKLEDITSSSGLDRSHGWWNTIEAVDMDGDGDEDLIAGNLGLNSKMKASEEEPATLFIKDFDSNGKLDHILCFYKNGLSVPFATRDELIKQLPRLRSKFISYEDYSRVATIHDIFSENQLEDALIKKAYHFQTSYIENMGDGTFSLHPLPVETQFSPVYAVLIDDYDKDGKLDILLGGNFSGATINFGMYDAAYGLFLRGDGLGGFKVENPVESGFVIKGEIRDIDQLKLANGKSIILIGRNNDSLGIVGVD
jgi:hypothetical protein